MRIRATTRRRGGGDLRDDVSIGYLTLTADSDIDREFITSIFRIVSEPNIERQEKGIQWMLNYLLPPKKKRRAA